MDLIEIYKKIFLIRTVENKLDELFSKGLVHGTAHFCVGQEFIPVIVSRHLTNKDFVTSTHRGHGHAIAKGLDVKRFLSELLGKKSGFNRGKGGSQHVISFEDGFLCNGITGGMAPIAVGLAFGNKYKKNKNVVVAYLGDGAITEGYVLEAINMSIVFGLPILFVCENNFYAMSTHVKVSHSNEIYKKIGGFGIKCSLVEDNDYIKLNSIAGDYIEKIRDGQGPFFVEVRTFRHKGHSKNDQNLYRDKEEEKHWFDLDVLKKIEEKIVRDGIMTVEDLNSMQNESKAYIDKIANEVVNESEEDPRNVLDHVYAE